jgi:LysR family transcriptional regulator for bpeEF and oprC
MDRLLAMQVFTTVVDAGSFSLGARRLKLSNATVSTLIRSLEAHLGVRLINRTTRRMHLTDDGTAYYERCRRILTQVEETENAFARARDLPHGMLRVDVPTAFGRLYFVPALPAFLDQYPDLRITVTMTDRRADLIEAGVDAAVRTGTLEDSTLVARRVYEARYVACASPEFLARYGEPKSPEDLSRFRCLGFYSLNTEQVTSWRFERDGVHITHEPDGHININSPDALVEAAKYGEGIIYLVDISVSRALAAGELKAVLTDWHTPAQPWSVVYPQTRHLSAKVRAFSDFVASMFPLPGPNTLPRPVGMGMPEMDPS